MNQDKSNKRMLVAGDDPCLVARRQQDRLCEHRCHLGRDQRRRHGQSPHDLHPPGGASPSWSPDGSKIAFGCMSNRICLVNPDGTGEDDITEGSPDLATHPSWSPDGTRIAFTGGLAFEGYSTLWVMNSDGTNPHRIVGLGTFAFGSGWPSWSPDGTQCAFSRRPCYMRQGSTPPTLTARTSSPSPSRLPALGLGSGLGPGTPTGDLRARLPRLENLLRCE